MPVAKKVKTLVDPARTALLWAAVLADPDSDTARNVLADHLTAAGDPRGEFIAVQLELARRGDKTERQAPTTKPLWARFRELHSRHSGKWLRPIKALGKRTTWQLHRGFVRALRISGDTATPELLASALAIEPVVELAIEAADARRLAKLLDVAGIERVRRLTIFGFDGRRVGSYIGTVLAKARRLAGVTELRVGIHLRDAGLAALGRATTLPAVTHLCLGAPEATPAGAAAFLASPLAKRLERLEWCRDAITPAIAAAVAKLPRLAYFMASIGDHEDALPALKKRFGAQFVVEDEPSFDYLFTSAISR